MMATAVSSSHGGCSFLSAASCSSSSVINSFASKQCASFLHEFVNSSNSFSPFVTPYLYFGLNVPHSPQINPALYAAGMFPTVAPQSSLSSSRNPLITPAYSAVGEQCIPSSLYHYAQAIRHSSSSSSSSLSTSPDISSLPSSSSSANIYNNRGCVSSPSAISLSEMNTTMPCTIPRSSLSSPPIALSPYFFLEHSCARGGGSVVNGDTGRGALIQQCFTQPIPGQRYIDEEGNVYEYVVDTKVKDYSSLSSSPSSCVEGEGEVEILCSNVRPISSSSHSESPYYVQKQQDDDYSNYEFHDMWRYAGGSVGSGGSNHTKRKHEDLCISNKQVFSSNSSNRMNAIRTISSNKNNNSNKKVCASKENISSVSSSPLCNSMYSSRNNSTIKKLQNYTHNNNNNNTLNCTTSSSSSNALSMSSTNPLTLPLPLSSYDWKMENIDEYVSSHSSYASNCSNNNNTKNILKKDSIIGDAILYDTIAAENITSFFSTKSKQKLLVKGNLLKNGRRSNLNTNTASSNGKSNQISRKKDNYVSSSSVLLNASSSGLESNHSKLDNKKRVNPGSGYPGVSWNSRMQAWLAFYMDVDGTRRSHTFKCAKCGGVEAARIQAANWLSKKRMEIKAAQAHVLLEEMKRQSIAQNKNQ